MARALKFKIRMLCSAVLLLTSICYFLLLSFANSRSDQLITRIVLLNRAAPFSFDTRARGYFIEITNDGVIRTYQRRTIVANQRNFNNILLMLSSRYEEAILDEKYFLTIVELLDNLSLSNHTNDWMNAPRNSPIRIPMGMNVWSVRIYYNDNNYEDNFFQTNSEILYALINKVIELSPIEIDIISH